MRRWFAWVAAILCMTAATMVSARTIVLSARGPSAARYPAGKTLPDPIDIALKAGDTLTLLDGSGMTVLKGPRAVKGRMSAALSPQDYALISTLAQARPKRVRVAGVSFNLDGPGKIKGGFTMRREPAPGSQGTDATRAKPAARPGMAAQPQAEAALAPAEASLWDIDPALGEQWCVQADSALSLFRSAASPALAITATPEGGAPVSRTWSAGANRLSLPADWANSQTDLKIVWRGAGQGGAGQSYQLVVNRIDDAPDTIVKLALALDAAECDVQLSRLEAIYRATPAAP